MIYGRVGSEELGENYHTLPLILAGDFNVNFATENGQLLTALNMSMRILSMIVKDRGILVVGIHPGWVKTEMGREEAPEEASDAIAQLFERMSQLNETHHGTFIEKNGTPIPF
ncbi:uncharacterized protein TNCT_136821 [Trichonephila clavata]|uniref:Uncharacterized protein n=1 Tax=Trichonephila clavata TaxID=2740835 RepID=A0A8X6K8J5_TRICU|nr:uncharacterized protein TNCT_136821 [Trichonephila clavata]